MSNVALEHRAALSCCAAGRHFKAYLHFPTLMKKVFPSQLHREKTVSMGDGMPQPSLIRRGLVVGGLLPFSSQ